MGRTTMIIHNHIWLLEDDSDVPNKKYATLHSTLKDMSNDICKKFNMYELFWNVGSNGSKFEIIDNDLSCDIEDGIKSILYFAKKVNIEICGSLTIYDDQTGGAYHVIVRFGPKHTAKIVTINDDVGDKEFLKWPQKRDISTTVITVD